MSRQTHQNASQIARNSKIDRALQTEQVRTAALTTVHSSHCVRQNVRMCVHVSESVSGGSGCGAPSPDLCGKLDPQTRTQRRVCASGVSACSCWTSILPTSPHIHTPTHTVLTGSGQSNQIDIPTSSTTNIRHACTCGYVQDLVSRGTNTGDGEDYEALYRAAIVERQHAQAQSQDLADKFHQMRNKAEVSLERMRVQLDDSNSQLLTVGGHNVGGRSFLDSGVAIELLQMLNACKSRKNVILCCAA